MIRIGARGSKLSTAQVKIVQDLLKNQLKIESEFVPITSHGDVNTSIPINKVIQEGAFTSTLETALINNEVDIAVHSFKDLPTTNPPELAIVAVLKRHDPGDLLIINKRKIVHKENHTFTFSKGTRIGTGSARRQSQLLHYHPDISTVDIRGNVETRLNKLVKGQYDGIILASAVLERITLEIPDDFEKIHLDVGTYPTAPAQGALCIQMKKNHPHFQDIQTLDDPETRFAVESERNILQSIGGGCQLPLGATIIKEDIYYILSLTLAPQNWRDYTNVPLTKVFIKESDKDKLAQNSILDLPTVEDENFSTIQNKEVILIGSQSTVEKYDNKLSSLGAIVTTIDMQTITTTLSLDAYKKHADIWLQSSWVLITSKNAIKALNTFNKYYPKKNLKVASIGFATTKLLQKNGYAVHFQAENTNAESLAEGLKQLLGKEESLLYLCASNAKKTLEHSFKADNYTFTEIAVYTNEKNLNIPKFPENYSADYIVVFSPEYCKLAIEEYGANIGKYWVSVGPSTTQKLQEFGIKNYKELQQVSVEDLLEVLQ